MKLLSMHITDKHVMRDNKGNILIFHDISGNGNQMYSPGWESIIEGEVRNLLTVSKDCEITVKLSKMKTPHLSLSFNVFLSSEEVSNVSTYLKDKHGL